MMMTWPLRPELRRDDRDCDRYQIQVLDLPRVAGRVEVAPPEGGVHNAKQNDRNR